jgi:hypothetical protein
MPHSPPLGFPGWRNGSSDCILTKYLLPSGGERATPPAQLTNTGNTQHVAVLSLKRRGQAPQLGGSVASHLGGSTLGVLKIQVSSWEGEWASPRHLLSSHGFPSSQPTKWPDDCSRAATPRRLGDERVRRVQLAAGAQG